MTRRWTRAARNIITSLADVAGDWLFWQYTVRDNPLLEKYNIPVFALAVVSAVFGLLSILNECYRCNSRLCDISREERGRPLAWLVCRLNRAHFAEMLFEDVGQIVISIMVIRDLYGWTPTLALNLSTSVLNMLFDALDVIDDYLDIADLSKMPS